ncbi:MAG: hypothetical protein RSD22_06355 [Romboutsia sp.]
MKSSKSEVLQIRLTALEKKVIREKAELLGMTVTDYIIKCCVFSNATEMFMEKFMQSNGK